MMEDVSFTGTQEDSQHYEDKFSIPFSTYYNVILSYLICDSAY